MDTNSKAADKNRLERYLKSLIHFMVKSTHSYDMGFEGEAQRLAVVVKAIVADLDGSGSLLEKVGLQELYFYDNSPDYNPALNLPMSGLALFAPTAKEKHRYAPRLGRNPGIPTRKVQFGQWWSKHVIIDDTKGLRLTRKDIIFTVSNTEADGPVRPMHNNEFNSLLKDNPIGWVDDRKSVKKQPLLGMEMASSRHIAFELLLAFEEQLPKYFEGATLQ